MTKINEKELKQLFSNLKNNNKSSLDELYKKYHNLVYGIAFSILKNREDSEDIVQIVFAKLHAIKKESLPTNKEASWLYTVTKNEAISLIKKKRNNIELDSIYEIADTESQINEVIDKDSFNRMISKLNNKEKEIISLKILSNLSFQEISKIINEPIGTIKWRYYKSTNTLKLLLSNLAMFIVTFVLGSKIMLNKTEKQNEAMQEETKNDNQGTTNLEDSTFDEPVKGMDTFPQISTSSSETEATASNYNVGMGLLSISAIFLVLTIIISIFYTKCKLRPKK